MPTYDYQCPSCGERFTSFRGINDESPSPCPSCGAEARRQISSGGGFIVKNGAAARPSCGNDVPCCDRGFPCGNAGGCRW